jgi:hypothetical protein
MLPSSHGDVNRKVEAHVPVRNWLSLQLTFLCGCLFLPLQHLLLQLGRQLRQQQRAARLKMGYARGLLPHQHKSQQQHAYQFFAAVASCSHPRRPGMHRN